MTDDGLDASWFSPEPKQLAFILSDAKETIYAGGFGSGKTLSGGFKALRTALKHPGTVGLVGRETARALADTTKKVLVDGDDKPPVIPPEIVAYRNDSENRVVLKNGSEILFRSFQDFNVGKVRSLNLGWVYVDEVTETSEKIWFEFLGRLRHPAGPRTAWGTTNPNGHDWVWRRFHPDGGDPTGPLFVSKTEENVHLAPDYLEYLRRMPREWQKRFLDCSFDTAAGQIWTEWDRTVHVVPEFDLPYQWDRFESLDHGQRNPTSILWWTIDFDGNLIVYDGYHEPGLPRQHAAAIIRKRGARKFGPIITAPDAFNMGNTGQRTADIYAEAGVQMIPANDNVETGILRVAEWLARQPDVLFPEWHPYAGTLGPDGLGAPRLYVLDTLGTLPLRTELPDYRWKDLSPAQEKTRDQPEEPRKKDDHAVDALRYGVMSRPRPTEDPEERARRNAERETRGRQRTFSAGIADRNF